MPLQNHTESLSPWRPATAIGKSAAVCANLLKISMEGIAEEAYLASKGNV